MRTILAAFLVILAAAPAAGAGPARRAADPPVPAPTLHEIRTTTQPIRIDGVLDEGVWETAWSKELPVEVTPGENTPAPVKTIVMLTYDREALYVGFRGYDPDPGAIRAHLTDRDSSWADDWIGIVLDMFNDQRRNYLLLVNPLGVQMDNIEVTNVDSQEWDGIWHSAARITEWGWAAEFKVPFSSLSFQRADGAQVWGFDAVRGYPRTIFRADMGLMPQVDYRRARSVARYQWLPGARTWFTNIYVFGEVTHDETQRGSFLVRTAIAGANYQGPLQSHIGLRLAQKRETYRGQVFDQTTFQFHTCGRPTGATNYSFNVSSGDRIDYAHASLGRRLRVNGQIQQRVGRHLQMALAPTWERLRVDEGQLYEALMADVRLTWQFTSRLFARGTVQFTDYSYDPRRYADGRDRSFAGTFTQMLLSYKVNPRTVFFLGYTDTREGADPDVLVQQGPTLFAKIGYAWSF